VGDDVEDVKRRIAELSVEVEMLKEKYMKCIEAIAKLREELESLRRKARRPSIRQHIEALKAYNEVEAGGPEPP
jgi:regulator of replication initiation timing